MGAAEFADASAEFDIFSMAGTATARRAVLEPFPWFSIVLIAVAALAVISTSAVRVLRISAAESAREQQWHIEHEALLRASADFVRGGGDAVQISAPLPDVHAPTVTP